MEDITAAIRRRSNNSALGHTVIYLPVVDSTNDVVRKAAQDGQSEGLVVLADRQTAGRGRLGRTWHGDEGSLMMSVLLRPSFHPSKLFALTMLSATATREAARRVSGLSCDLKWPNDLQIGGKKLGGILAEAGLRGEELDFAIIGLGLNVNLAVDRYPNISATATSLRHELGREVDRVELLCAILEQIEIRYEMANEGRFDAIHQEWRTALVSLGKPVWVIDRGQVLEGLAEDVDAEGTLLLRTADGEITRVVTGDVSLREAVH